MRRRGTSLLEVLIVIGSLSLILGVVAMCLGTMYQLDRRMGDELEEVESVSRLALRLRRDSRQARDARLEDPAPSGESGPTLVLELGGGRQIRYATSPRGLLRTRLQQGEVVHRDLFRLSEGSTATFEVTRHSERPLATIVIRPAATAEQAAGSDPPAQHLEAGVGRAAMRTRG